MDDSTKTLELPWVRFGADADGDITVYPPVHDYRPPGFHRPDPPKNNDGRQHCFWCDTKTVKRGYWKEYDICPDCDK